MTNRLKTSFSGSIMLALISFLLSAGIGLAAEYQIQQLTENEYHSNYLPYSHTGENLPCIHNGQIVWIAWDGNGDEIFLYNGTNVIQLTNNEYDDRHPQIHRRITAQPNATDAGLGGFAQGRTACRLEIGGPRRAAI